MLAMPSSRCLNAGLTRIIPIPKDCITIPARSLARFSTMTGILSPVPKSLLERSGWDMRRMTITHSQLMISFLPSYLPVPQLPYGPV